MFSPSCPLEHLSADVSDTDGVFWLDDDRMPGHHLDILDASDARVLLQQLSRRPSSLSGAFRHDVLPPGEVKALT
jgi:hypothetical protein